MSKRPIKDMSDKEFMEAMFNPLPKAKHVKLKGLDMQTLTVNGKTIEEIVDKKNKERWTI